MITLTKVSETPLTITLGFTPVPGATGYRFTAENQVKPSHTWDPTRSSVRFQKGSAWYRVEALGVTDSGGYPPPAPISAHFISDWSTGKIGYPPWSTIFSYTPPGYQDVGLYGAQPRQASADGRVAVVPNPYGPGNVLRCEIRDSDPFPSTLAKAELGSVRDVTCGGQFSPGMELWFLLELYFPDDFGFAMGGPNPFTTIADLHPRSGTGTQIVGLSGYSQTHVQVYGGASSIQRVNLFPLDSAHRNRKIEVVLGAKLDTAGWFEAWVDGQNVVPRRQASMIAADESGPYWKQGLYSHSESAWPGGRSVVYHGRTLIGKTKESLGA